MVKIEQAFKASSNAMKKQIVDNKNDIAEHKKASEILEKKVLMGNLALQNEKTKHTQIIELLTKVSHSHPDSRLMS